MSRTYSVQTIIHSCPVLPIQDWSVPWDTCQYIAILYLVCPEESIRCVRRILVTLRSIQCVRRIPVTLRSIQCVRRIPVTLRSIQCVRRFPHPCDRSGLSGGSLTLYRSGGLKSPSGVCGGSQVTLRSTGGSHLAGVCVRGHPPVGPRPPCDLAVYVNPVCLVYSRWPCMQILDMCNQKHKQCTQKLLKNPSFLIYSLLFGYNNL